MAFSDPCDYEPLVTPVAPLIHFTDSEEPEHSAPVDVSPQTTPVVFEPEQVVPLLVAEVQEIPVLPLEQQVPVPPPEQLSGFAMFPRSSDSNVVNSGLTYSMITSLNLVFEYYAKKVQNVHVFLCALIITHPREGIKRALREKITYS